MNKNITSPSGLTLLTAGKYCNQDITVKPVLQEKTTTENGEVTADSGYTGLSKVTVNVASGAELNIAYGDTAPEDTTKLWVEGAEPSKVIATNKMNGSETLNTVNAYLPNNLSGAGCASVGDNVYIFGGRSSSSSSSWASIICKFNTKTKTLTKLDVYLPYICEGIKCASVGTNIYLFGGGVYSSSTNKTYYNTILKFDTVTETITTLSATLPSVNSYMGCVAVGTNIYLFGGYAFNGNSYYNKNYYNTILKFDTITETITTLSATLGSYGRAYMGCALVGSDIYIMGGGGYTSSSSSSSYTSAEIKKFDTVTETITTLSTTLPSKMNYVSCASIGSDIYIFGNNSNVILKFNTVNETFEILSATLPNAIQHIGVGVVGTNIYLCGGTYYNTIYEFAVSVDLPENQLLLNTTLNKNLFKIINTPSAEIEIGVNGVYRGNANNIAELETANVYDSNQYAWVDVQSGAVVEKLASAVTITSQASDYAFNVYDGTNTSGNLVATLGGTNGTLTAKVPCFSGYLYFQNTNASTAWEGFTVANNMTVTGGTDNYQLVQVNGDGAISATVVEVSAGYQVTITPTEYNTNTVYVYDGENNGGTLLARVTDSPVTVTCTTGFLYLEPSYASDFNVSNLSSNLTISQGQTGTTYDSIILKVTGDGSFTVENLCFIEGTMITLADGSTKACEDITYDDELLVWDFYKGKFDSAKPTWIKVKQVASQYNKVTFDNGAEVGFVGPANLGYHRIFNKEAGKFTYTGASETPNGTTTLSCNTRGGWTKVVSQEIIKEKVAFYNIITEKHYNLFANGILTSCRLSNKYAIKDMKYVGDLLITAEEEKLYFERIESLKVKKQQGAKNEI